MVIDIVKVILPAALAFFIGISITPILTTYLYKHKVWKSNPGKIALDGKDAIEFNKIHKEREGRTPRMGGIMIWGSVILTTFLIWGISRLFPTETTIKLDFISRDQTWIPLFTLAFGGVVGFVNDLLDVRGESNGLALSKRLLAVVAMSAVIGWWFYSKLEITSVGIPFDGALSIGWLIIPFFVITVLALYASGVIDGIDGLSGGVFASIFLAYAGIAFYQQQINLAAFAATVAGALLAFLWFNVPPARFWMTETGTMSLTLTIAVLAFMTDSLGGGYGIAVLPIIAFLLVATVLSVIIQTLSKRFRGKKVFLVAPLHHHFEAIGWPGHKVAMRYWILSIIFAFLGVIIALAG
ncbi:MAG: hypothetical protein ISR99_00855 [Parcubacteria group bacterium]|nr:hypothetical protein [Parcubacteria group bacterium]